MLLALTVALWGLTGVCALIGVWLVFAPQSFAGVAKTFLRPAHIRILGVVLMVLGTLIFARAAHTGWPLFAKVVGVILFVKGGLNICIPDTAIVVMDWWFDRAPAIWRVLGILELLIAAAFAHTALGVTADPQGDKLSPAAVEDLSQQVDKALSKD